VSFTNVFGGSTIFPSDVSYLALAVNADVNLSWPLETTSGVDIAARIIDVTPNASGRSVYLPDATKTGAGQTILFNNVSATYTVFIKDYAGNTLATLGTSSQWQFYLSGVSTTAGTWRVFQYGAAGSGAAHVRGFRRRPGARTGQARAHRRVRRPHGRAPAQRWAGHHLARFADARVTASPAGIRPWLVRGSRPADRDRRPTPTASHP
jgi:hypothetical protein